MTEKRKQGLTRREILVAFATAAAIAMLLWEGVKQQHESLERGSVATQSQSAAH